MFIPLDASGMASRRAFIQGKIDELRKELKVEQNKGRNEMRISKAQESAIIERVARYLCEEEGDSPDDPNPEIFQRKTANTRRRGMALFAGEILAKRQDEIVINYQNPPKGR